MTLRRRDFITLLSGAAAWPPVALAQQLRMPVIGFLHPGSPEAFASRVAGFRNGLSETGYVEGRNVAIEYRWAFNERDRLPELAADLIRRRVDVIATPGGGGAGATEAAKAATGTIPIIFSTGADPIQLGLVASLNRPGANVTGINDMNSVLGPKRLGLLDQLLPRGSPVAVLVNPTNADTDSVVAELQSAAGSISRPIEILSAATKGEIDKAFAYIREKQIGALLVQTSPFLNTRRIQIITLAAHFGVPVIYPWREAVEVGGLMYYGTSGAEEYRQVGIYTGRILKGEKPADLPVMRASKFEFVINLQTARALGVEIPPTLLALADEVIE